MFAALVGCSPVSISTPAASPTPIASENEAIVLADISDEPTRHIEEFQPLADYLAAHLGEGGVGEVKIAPDMPTMAKWIAAGEVDIYFDSPYPAMIVGDESGAQPILRRWKDNVSEYHTVIFARSDRGVKTLADLRGKTIAFEDNFSTSGYMLPLAHMTEAGLDLVEKAEATQQVASDQVGYFFDENGIQWVLSDRVAAAAVSSEDFAEIPEATRQQLIVLARTESLPRHLVMVSPKLDADRQAAIATILKNMDETAEGRAVLQQFEETAQFDDFPQGAEAALARMRSLYEQVERQDR